jgi:PAS domain S-box-containing protein
MLLGRCGSMLDNREEQKVELPPNIQETMGGVFDWFEQNVQRLETAYSELGRQFEKVNSQLEQTNLELQAALQQKTLMQTRLEALLTSMIPGVIMVDPSMHITMLNSSAEKILGVSALGCVGKPLDDVFTVESGVGVSLRHALMNPSTLDTLEHDNSGVTEERTFFLEGRQIPAVCTASQVIDSQGALLGAVETFTDASDRKKMEREMQQVRVLSALGEMAATVAHEIRNPLGGIGGYAGLLARGIPAEDPKRRLVDKIMQGVNSMNKIVSNLLFYTRKTVLQTVRLDLCEWIQDVIGHFEVEILADERPITLIKTFPEQPIFVAIDPERFQQVILNLLQNAAQAIEGQGSIQVEIYEKKQSVVIRIVDSGYGISVEDQKQIFTPFFTTKENGTGLGLAIVRKLVELHGGVISLQSEPGKGCEISLELNRQD